MYMFGCCISKEETSDELNFSLYNKNIKGECNDLCITFTPFNEVKEKEKTPSKIKWDVNVKVITTYSSREYDRSVDTKQIATNLKSFKKWFSEKYQNIKGSKRMT